MGQAKNRRDRFLADNPFCAFCGGLTPAVTVEHCPPRTLFQNRHWPEGFEFPACERCNLETGDQDAIVAMLARMDPIYDRGNMDGRLVGLMKNVNAQFPGLVSSMIPSAAEARRHNRELGIEPAPGQTHQETGYVKVPEEMHVAVCVFARKLAKAIFFHEVDKIFPSEGCLMLNWFTNVELLREGDYKMFDLLKEIGGNAPLLQRTGKYLNDQFEFKATISPQEDVFVIQARFGNAFGLVVFGCTRPGPIESTIERLRQESGKNGPFAVLQSRVLQTAA